MDVPMRREERWGKLIAVIETDRPVIVDGQSALDLLMAAQHYQETLLVALPRAAVSQDFFVIASGLAGTVLQKVVNYHCKLAIWGDFSDLNGEAWLAFRSEAGGGPDLFLVANLDEALERLGRGR